MSESFLRNLIPGARKVRRTNVDLIASWLGTARLTGEPQGQLLNRRHYRWPSQKAVLLWLDSGDKIPVHAFDLSGGGAGFLVTRAIEIGSSVRISAVDDPFGRTCVEATVVYVLEPSARGVFPTGVQFEEWGPREI